MQNAKCKRWLSAKHGVNVAAVTALAPLSLPLAFVILHFAFKPKVEWARLDSNQGPTDYEPAALTAELRALSNRERESRIVH